MTREYSVEELVIWEYRIPDASEVCSVGRPTLPRPNPIVVGDLVIASVWAEGQIVAVDRTSGVCRWRYPLGYLGMCSVIEVDGILYGGTPKSLVALDAATGAKIWEFAPPLWPSANVELMYSLPVIAGPRLFIGDRGGKLHCLDRRTGRVFWSRRPSPKRNHSVNCTAVVIEDRVYSASNGGWLAAFEAGSGRRIWRRMVEASYLRLMANGQDLDALGFHSNLVENIYTQSGDIVATAQWPGMEPAWIDALGDLTCFGLRDMRTGSTTIGWQRRFRRGRRVSRLLRNPTRSL